jgi:DNA-binding NarL/FixJ family response regulator
MKGPHDMTHTHLAATDGHRVQVPTDWFAHILRTTTDGERRAIVEDAAGHRFVIISEAHYRALEDAERAQSQSQSQSQSPARPTITLTAREQEILQLIAEGCPGAVAAERLGLAPNTVAQHLVAVRRKYGVHSSAAAAALARQSGLIS